MNKISIRTLLPPSVEGASGLIRRKIKWQWMPIHKAQAHLQLFLSRSHGLLTHLNYPFFMDDNSLAFVAYRAPLLEVLHMPNSSWVTDDWVLQLAPMLRSITDLDLSGCSGLSHVALEALGKNCRKVTHLRKNRNFFYTHHPCDEEALAIAQHFPRLQHLELANAPFSIDGLRAILWGCVALTSLDLRGRCQHLEMSEVFIMECKQRLGVFLEPGDDTFLMFDLQGPEDAVVE
ncbi:hypothetical protein GOP47_0026294 [Adiantum capillus-veneris]|nr:hypothetical protein GOP47_0026294 [Adiantum capillus-veneris]